MWWILFSFHLLSFWNSVSYVNQYPHMKPSLSTGEILPLVLFNQLVMTPIFSLCFSKVNPKVVQFENISEVIWYPIQYPLMIITFNLIFSFFHIMFHKIRFLYKNVHSVHHRLRTPHPIGSIYAHPIEHIFGNLLSIGVAIWLVSAKFWLASIFIIHTAYETVDGHIQYMNPEICSKHFIHHAKMVYNYDNSPYLIDKIIGSYRETLNQKVY